MHLNLGFDDALFYIEAIKFIDSGDDSTLESVLDTDTRKEIIILDNFVDISHEIKKEMGGEKYSYGRSMRLLNIIFAWLVSRKKIFIKKDGKNVLYGFFSYRCSW